MPADEPADSRECPFCRAIFSRVDSARRHAQRCGRRQDQRLPTRKRGRRSKACQRCVRLKIHCQLRDGTTCEGCASRKLRCEFNHSSRNPDALRATTDQHDVDVRCTLNFLLNYTDSKLDLVMEKAVGEHPCDWKFDFFSRDLSDPSCTLDSIFSAQIESALWTSPLMFDNFNPEREADGLEELFVGLEENRLPSRIGLLRSELKSYVNLNRDANVAFNSLAFEELFTSTNVASFAAAFCRKRHYQYPIIHWPSLELEAISLPLLLAVSLIGAAYSIEEWNGEAVISAARGLYPLADLFISSRLEEHSSRSSEEPQTAANLEICQASLLMYILSGLSGSDTAIQQVAIAKRLPQLISSLRRFGFVGHRHAVKEDTAEFLHSEKIIRLVTWTFCAECLTTLAFNRPPAFSLMEMSGDLPCVTSIWEDKETAMLERQGAQIFSSARLCLTELMGQILGSRACDQTSSHATDEQLSVTHLQIMLCAFQQIIFNADVSMSLPFQSQRLLFALEKWSLLWAKALKRLTAEERKWMGVARHTHGLAHLSQGIVEVAAGSDRSRSNYLRRKPSTDRQDLHEFLREFVVQAGPAEGTRHEAGSVG